MPSPRQPAKSNNFSIAFERMCNFVAISQTKSAEETLRELILQCFVVLPDETFKDAADILEAINALYVLQVVQGDIVSEVDVLVGAKSLSRPAGTNYVLDPTLRGVLQKRLDEANELEDTVRDQWFVNVGD
jgi:hypothetical protein